MAEFRILTVLGLRYARLPQFEREFSNAGHQGLCPATGFDHFFEGPFLGGPLSGGPSRGIDTSFSSKASNPFGAIWIQADAESVDCSDA